MARRKARAGISRPVSWVSSVAVQTNTSQQLGGHLSGVSRVPAGNGPTGKGKAPRAKRGDRGRADRRHGLLRADATVTFAAEREAAGIDDIIGHLNRELVGLAVVKRRVEEIAALL